MAISEAAVLDWLTTPSAPRSAPPAPAPQPRELSQPENWEPFAIFGELIEWVDVVRQNSQWDLVRWLALRPALLVDGERAWRECCAANPGAWQRYLVVRLSAPSFFLPQAEVLFKATLNPTQIPEAPPLGVRLRHLEALDAHPEATVYYLEPVFTLEPTPHLCDVPAVRREATLDRQASLAAARRYGAFFRAQLALARLPRRIARWALTTLADAAEQRTWNRQESTFRAARLRLHAEQETVDEELARDLAWQRDRLTRLRRQLDRDRLPWDPVLCFTLPHEPHRLRFETHWYRGVDGRTYVHY